jgi:hypothetical protein
MTFIIGERRKMNAEPFKEAVHSPSELLGNSDAGTDFYDLMEFESRNIRGSEAVSLLYSHMKEWVGESASAIRSLISRIWGSASSGLFDLWQVPSSQSPPSGRMLVIAVRKDASKRRIWEDAFAGGLSKQGVKATASYRLFPDAPPDTDQVKATMQANGFDGILVISRPQGKTNTRFSLSTSTYRWPVRE